MALEDLDLPPLLDKGPMPASVSALIAAADAAGEALVERHIEHPILGFVPSDGAEAYRGLAALKQSGLLPGPLLCEWGSGLGTAAILGAWLGYDAYGIEIEAELVEESERLAAEMGVEVTFVCGSLLPEGFEPEAEHGAELNWLETNAPSAYEALDIDIDDIDVVYAYPWPGEEEALYEAFDAEAARGALLLTWHGKDGLRLQRKR